VAPIPGQRWRRSPASTQWGYHVVVATNQSGVGRGLFDMDALNAINDKMIKAVAQAGGRLDAIFFCPHAPRIRPANAASRSPACCARSPNAISTDLKDVPCRRRQPARPAGGRRHAGAQPILVLTGKGAKTHDHPDLPRETLVFPDLAAAAAHIAA
jgi:D-glycero-D-manno-heptose 1,7-bisphosphate phosphatase